ncbi:family 3 encapsulin nanocompartment shell protein [Streptomyces sp. JJ36]|uniref:family 3 encapsulin nanocompartment shell protein n=1 Tax=Streptomyces sp. JJ36 TaxID=2736645 RepID=UPI001F364EBD|nr:family 3 encapsulin nanocompartment shell protein [Streptomyces sp. JJ36]MCF6522659.1 phage major capsid protein [Streptomyces sp. JJ36]
MTVIDEPARDDAPAGTPPAPDATPPDATPPDAPHAGGPSPGALFARALTEDPAGAEVRFGFTLTDAFQPGRERPRLTARDLFLKQRVGSGTVHGWSETRPETEVRAESGMREDTYRFGAAGYAVRPVTAWVRIPGELAGHPDALAHFVDRRLMVRLGTAENRALTRDVLDHPGVRSLAWTGSYTEGLLAAYDEIEQSGGTAHAMMVNPRDYYRELVGSGSLLADLAREQVKVCRHRQVAPGCALVGDFAMAARLLDAEQSVIKVAEPPPGALDRTDPGTGTAVCAVVHESVAVQLPTHFFHVVPG